MLEIVVIALLQCGIFLTVAFFFKYIIQHGIIKGIQKYSLLVEAVLTKFWNIYLRIIFLILEPIFSIISWPFEKFFSWAEHQKFSVVVYLTK